jgi:hypothetical protein
MQTSAPTTLDRKRIIGGDEAYKNLMRLECQTDHIFLAHRLGYLKVIERVHRPVARLFVQKNPALSIEQQAENKPFLHLDPRGTFKSTLSIVDIAQWIICFPDCAICLLTATKPLAAAITGEIADHFVKAKDAAPTDFQLLFPEFCITPREKMVGEFTAPNRKTTRKEATVMSFSIETSISGWHFDVMVPDDIVDTQNSATAQAIAKVKKNWRTNKKTLMPWGYINYKGTRYNPLDLWGDIIEKADGKKNKLRVLIRAALKLKDGGRLEPGEFPPASAMELLFPELLSYEFLKDEFDDDYESFMTQYMNDAQGGNEVTFSKEDMLRNTIDAEEIPVSGEMFISWRFAYSGKPAMRYTGAAVGLMEGNRMFIVDILRGTFKPSGLAHRIVQLAKKHGVRSVSIEETPGAKYLESAIHNYALTLGWNLNISWLEFQDDDGVRDLRIKGMEPLVTSQRLLFSTAILPLKEMYNQFSNYGMVAETEIPDAVSRVVEHLPKSLAASSTDAEQDMNWELLKQRDLYDRTHGIGQYAPQEPVVQEVYVEPTNKYGLEDILGGLNG